MLKSSVTYTSLLKMMMKRDSTIKTPYTLNWKETTILDDKCDELAIVNLKYKLKHSVKENLYNYLSDSL